VIAVVIIPYTGSWTIVVVEWCRDHRRRLYA
jgi:hypothetical protein